MTKLVRLTVASVSVAIIPGGVGRYLRGTHRKISLQSGAESEKPVQKSEDQEIGEESTPLASTVVPSRTLSDASANTPVRSTPSPDGGFIVGPDKRVSESVAPSHVAQNEEVGEVVKVDFGESDEGDNTALASAAEKKVTFKTTLLKVQYPEEESEETQSEEESEEESEELRDESTDEESTEQPAVLRRPK